MEELIEEVEIPVEEVITEEVIDMPEEEPVLDPEEIITEDFGVICKQDGEVIAYGFWQGTRDNVKRLEEWAEYGYEKTSDKYVQGYDGKWYIEGAEPEKPAPTYEEVQKARASAYEAEVDPITAHINRLRDEEQTAEVAAKIAELVEERKALVAKIKEENPYPTEPVEEIDELPVVEVIPEMENVTEEID